MRDDLSVAGILLAVALGVFRRLWLIVAGAGLMAATAPGLLLSVYAGLFGFQESMAAPHAGNVPGRGDRRRDRARGRGRHRPGGRSVAAAAIAQRARLAPGGLTTCGSQEAAHVRARTGDGGRR